MDSIDKVSSNKPKPIIWFHISWKWLKKTSVKLSRTLIFEITANLIIGVFYTSLFCLILIGFTSWLYNKPNFFTIWLPLTLILFFIMIGFLVMKRIESYSTGLWRSKFGKWLRKLPNKLTKLIKKQMRII